MFSARTPDDDDIEDSLVPSSTSSRIEKSPCFSISKTRTPKNPPLFIEPIPRSSATTAHHATESTSRSLVAQTPERTAKPMRVTRSASKSSMTSSSTKMSAPGQDALILQPPVRSTSLRSASTDGETACLLPLTDEAAHGLVFFRWRSGDPSTPTYSESTRGARRGRLLPPNAGRLSALGLGNRR